MAAKWPRYELDAGPDIDLQREDVRDRRGGGSPRNYVERR